MTTGNTADPRIVSNSHPAAATISDNLGRDEGTGPSGRPRFPLVVWTPRIAPMVMGADGIWARSLMEMMFAGQQVTSGCLALECVGSPKTADSRKEDYADKISHRQNRE